jgi:hypothetical protein
MAAESLFENVVQGAFTMEDMIAERARTPMQWEQPHVYDLADPGDRSMFRDALARGDIKTTYDPIESLAGELYEMENPGAKFEMHEKGRLDERRDRTPRAAYIDDIKSQGVEFGNWVVMPWSKEAVRYAGVDEHRALRTSRNRNLVTPEEQQTLYDKTVAVFGLSVGSNVLRDLVISGIGGKVVFGDADSIELSNLNRINGGQTDIGVGKVDLAARKISEIDPYIEQVHFRQGINAANIDKLAAEKPSIIFDEVDNFAAKVLLRQFAKQEGIPLVMATDAGDNSIIDVERHDLGDTELFNGRLTAEEISRIETGVATPDEMKGYMVKVVGMENISERTLSSFMQVGQTLPGVPQLGVTASKGAALATFAAREVLLGHDIASGRYAENPHQKFDVTA